MHDCLLNALACIGPYICAEWDLVSEILLVYIHYKIKFCGAGNPEVTDNIIIIN